MRFLNLKGKKGMEKSGLERIKIHFLNIVAGEIISGKNPIYY